ncbi:hypothetical protein WN51_01856 [Melipona quadrifasciata]|uniref:Uncharacterized protein n=1 Tax=Melipona quadrifasciata TaxID=166423 RepID=A0A0M8ZZ94_9HYME|nr:hypothetical protein WN51_01856 [Melipona quadrifasciata]
MNEPDPCLPLILPPRYRLRDLILGDYAFNDDGERTCPLQGRYVEGTVVPFGHFSILNYPENCGCKKYHVASISFEWASISALSKLDRNKE